jgi:hypothetical protein
MGSNGSDVEMMFFSCGVREWKRDFTVSVQPPPAARGASDNRTGIYITFLQGHIVSLGALSGQLTLRRWLHLPLRDSMCFSLD